MNRFKFRAWHKGAKEMLESRQQGYQGNVFAWLAEGQPVEIMQYTGLKDKNGREIYEGDILSFTGLAEYHRKPFVIEWDKLRARYSDYSPRQEAEIIGNIYENPELLS